MKDSLLQTNSIPCFSLKTLSAGLIYSLQRPTNFTDQVRSYRTPHIKQLKSAYILQKFYNLPLSKINCFKLGKSSAFSEVFSSLEMKYAILGNMGDEKGAQQTFKGWATRKRTATICLIVSQVRAKAHSHVIVQG